ncbi:hypothetical protein L21TH_0294 [Caldisalinibacter kiritimatiensis]|uniref:Uncharacterized protein n=1 Tax=Caldisalinibacter kiritimatiensis TaxID=1304284 RepID=R1AWQ4_9FIRM|nr:hypothetical protein L21TH_0294 [Caldisalinibacter kiritimatiensis]
MQHNFTSHIVKMKRSIARRAALARDNFTSHIVKMKLLENKTFIVA